MSRFDKRLSLPAMAMLAVLMASPHALPAQSAAAPTPSAPSPVQPEAQPAAQAPASAPSEPATQNQALPPATPQPFSAMPVNPPTPINPLTPEQLGDSLTGHQRYQAAIAAYAKEKDPTAGLWNKMGIAYQMMFNLKDATRCYNASLKLDPHNAKVLNNLGTVYDSLKQYGTGERYYRKALKIDPHAALILRNFGSNQLAQHRYKKGWEAYQSALKADPQIFETHTGASVQNPASTQDRGAMHYYMARGCVSAGNSECAIQNLRLALNEGYTNPQKIAGDNSFASLRELPAFQQLIAAQSAPQ
jgi:tetratricopeptide (TPR) repeat protein